MIQSFIDSYSLSQGAVGTTQVRTGYGFQPKLVIALSHNRGTSDGTGAQNSLMSIGFADGTLAMRNLAWEVLDQNNPVTAGAGASTARLAAIYGRGSGSVIINGEWEISAVGSDGLTTRVTDQYNDGETPAVILLALGGSAIASVTIGSFTLQDPPGTEVVSGLAFAPDGVLFLPDAGGSGGAAGLGAAVRRGSVTSANSSTVSSSGTSPPADSYTRYGECVSVTSGVQRGVLSAWRSDGFEVTSLDDPIGTFPRTVHYAAFRMAPGFDCRIMTGNTASSLTTVDFTTTGDFTPHSGLLVSSGNAQSAAGVSDSNAGLSIGAYTQTQQYGIAWHTTNLSSNSTCTAYSSGSVYTNMGVGDVVDGAMAITGRSKGVLTGTMSNADPTPAAVWSLAFGSIPLRRGAPIFF